MADIPKYLKAPDPTGADILGQLSGLQDEEDLVNQQLEAAMALRGKAGGRGHGLLGGLGQGLQTFANQLVGGIEQRDAEARKKALGGRMGDAQRSLYGYLTAPGAQDPTNYVAMPGRQGINPYQQGSLSVGPFTFGGGNG